MSEIKFQTDGAERIYECLFERKSTKRYLLADEVGLGKTVTAARVIAKLAEKNVGKTIHIGYICGNKALAIQNTKKLRDRILEQNPEVLIDNKKPENLSLGFLTIDSNDNDQSCNNTKIVIHVVTPSTTIKVTSKGTKTERAYAYLLLTNEKWNQRDDILWETCQGKAGQESFDAEVVKAEKKINNNHFIKSFESLLEKEWQSSKDSIVKKCLNKILEKYFDDEPEDAYEALFILKCLNKIKSINQSKKWKETCQKLDKNKREEIESKVNNIQTKDLDYYKKILENIPRNIEKYFYVILDKLQTSKKKKQLSEFFLKIYADNNDSIEWTKDIIESILKSCGYTEEITESLTNEYKKEEFKDNNKVILEEIREEIKKNCVDEYVRLARKCMAVASIDIMDMDFFIADEIQNYSELFKVIKGENGSEMGLVVNKVIQGNKKLLLMSATPFRYHSHMNFLENMDKDMEADNNDDEEEIEQTIASQKYLEEDTDIYQEFKMIIEYLNSKFDFDKWKSLNEKKYELLDNNNEIVDLHKKTYTDYVSEQSKMLLESYISRVERYMSGISICFKTINKTVPMDEIYFKELCTIPKGSLREYIGEKDKITHYIRYDGKYYCKVKCEVKCKEGCKVEEKFWKSNFNDGLGGNTVYDAEEYPLEDDENAGKIIKELESAIRKDSVRLDYIKSTPALFSFSHEDYTTLENKSDEKNLLSYERVNNFQEIFATGKPCCNESSSDELLYNARVAMLFRELFDKEELHKLLFVPPANLQISENGLAGVFEGKWGSSKRLFFTDYAMTSKSLSAIITYEAARRVNGDLRKRFIDDKYISYIPGGNKKIRLDVLYNYFEWNKSSDCDNTKYDVNIKEFVDTENLPDILFEFDKSINQVNYGSPYSYVSQRKEFFNEEQKKKFCRAYFKYMSCKSSLKVVLAYCSGDKPKSIYDAIIQYGKDGCIWAVFDEYAEYIVKGIEKEESFADAFARVLNRDPKTIKANFKSDINKLMPTDFAFGHYLGAKENMSSAETLEEKIQRFNSPFRPFNFISTSIGQEGFDFHVYCRKIVHWSLEYNPVKFEQREGRINRYQGYSNRLKLAGFLKSNKIDDEFDGWKKAFEKVKEYCEDYRTTSKGLFPDYAVPEDNAEEELKYIGLEREGYYYPDSFEDYKISEVLKTVGYYRSLLGQSGNDTFEEKFRDFTENIASDEMIQFFINLYPG